jgi:hypothetical protein
MNRLQKFIEQGAYGEKSGRIAYAFVGQRNGMAHREPVQRR